MTWRTTKEEQREYYRIYRAAHRERIRESQKKYYESHREEINIRTAINSIKHRKLYPEKVAETNRKWRENNHEYDLERQRKWHSEHRNEGIEYSRNYRENNLEKCKLSAKKSRQKYPEKGREYQRRRKAWKLSAPGRGITATQERELFEEYAYHCAYCGRGDRPLEIDHIEPLSKGGAHDIDNATVACHSCNAKKGDKTLLRFLYDRRQLELWKELKNGCL